MASYPLCFKSTPLEENAKKSIRSIVPAQKEWEEDYQRDLQAVQRAKDDPKYDRKQWANIPKCKCGRLAHLVATSSVIPIFPCWQKDKLCAFHCPERHTPRIIFQS